MSAYCGLKFMIKEAIEGKKRGGIDSEREKKGE